MNKDSALACVDKFRELILRLPEDAGYIYLATSGECYSDHAPDTEPNCTPATTHVHCAGTSMHLLSQQPDSRGSALCVLRVPLPAFF